MSLQRNISKWALCYARLVERTENSIFQVLAIGFHRSFKLFLYNGFLWEIFFSESDISRTENLRLVKFADETSYYDLQKWSSDSIFRNRCNPKKASFLIIYWLLIAFKAYSLIIAKQICLWETLISALMHNFCCICSNSNAFNKDQEFGQK